MGLKFGQKYQISIFLGSAAILVATKVSCRDKAFLSRHWSSMSRHTAACRDILLLVATSVAMSRHTVACRDILSHVATYFPDSSQFFFSNLSEP